MKTIETVDVEMDKLYERAEVLADIHGYEYRRLSGAGVVLFPVTKAGQTLVFQGPGRCISYLKSKGE